MKYKHLAMIMGVMITATSVGSAATAFAADSKTESTQNAGDTTEDTAEASDTEESNEILGEVKSVEDGKITIAVGTRKEMNQPGEQPQGSGNGEAPEEPDGDAKDSEDADDKKADDVSADESADTESTDETVDDKTDKGEAPDGEAPDGEAPSMLELTGEEQEITVTDSTVITKQSMGGGQGGSGGQASGVDSYDAANEYSSDETVSDTSLESTGTDENAALVSNGAEVTFNNDVISRTSSDSQGGDNSSFYGVGAAVLATDGTAYVKDITVTTDSKGGAGLFAYGDGTVYAADTNITTQQDTSGGIHAAGGGTLYAWGLNVETNGESSAAIRSDRGGGKMVVDGGTYTSNGVGSPAVYCTADIAVNNAELTANGSEAVCIEGLNSLRLYNSNLTGNMSDDDQNDTTWTVILYQSMSGDSEVGNSTFQMDGGTITSQNGGLFYTTNTECTIALKDVDITYNDDSEFFLQCTGNNNQRGWGQSGANGSDCSFTADSQDMKGNVIWDSISDLDFYMTNGSTLEGAFVNDETYAGNGGDGYCNVVIDKESTWTVTGDSTITSLSNAGTITDADGKTVSIVGTDGTTYAEGDSDYTITVGSYHDSADTSSATSVDDWSNYETEKPENL